MIEKWKWQRERNREEEKGCGVLPFAVWWPNLRRDIKTWFHLLQRLISTCCLPSAYISTEGEKLIVLHFPSLNVIAGWFLPFHILFSTHTRTHRHTHTHTLFNFFNSLCVNTSGGKHMYILTYFFIFFPHSSFLLWHPFLCTFLLKMVSYSYCNLVKSFLKHERLFFVKL